MEFIRKDNIIELSNPGVTSRQLINSENSKSERVTITEVHLEVGASQPRHKHDTSEQIWYIFLTLGNKSRLKAGIPVTRHLDIYFAGAGLYLFVCITVAAVVG